MFPPGFYISIHSLVRCGLQTQLSCTPPEPPKHTFPSALEVLTDVSVVFCSVDDEGGGVVVEVAIVVGVEVEDGITSGVRFALLAAMAEDTLAQAAASRELIPALVGPGGGTSVVIVTVGGATVDSALGSEALDVITVVMSTVLRGGV